MRLEKVDISIIAIAAFILMASSYNLLKNNTTRDYINKKIIAKLEHTENKVQIKNINDLNWTNITKEENVHKDDLIFTGPKSLAKIRFNNSSNLTISQDTMILINDQNNYQLSNDKAQISTFTNAGSEMIINNNKITSIEKSNLIIKRNKNQVRLDIKTGKIKINKGKILDNSKSYIIQKERVFAIPKNKEVIFSSDHRPRIKTKKEKKSEQNRERMKKNAPSNLDNILDSIKRIMQNDKKIEEIKSKRNIK